MYYNSMKKYCGFFNKTIFYERLAFFVVSGIRPKRNISVFTSLRLWEQAVHPDRCTPCPEFCLRTYRRFAGRDSCR